MIDWVYLSIYDLIDWHLSWHQPMTLCAVLLQREMERLRETFMKELTEMNEKNSASEMAVQKLQRQLG